MLKILELYRKNLSNSQVGGVSTVDYLWKGRTKGLTGSGVVVSSCVLDMKPGEVIQRVKLDRNLI